MWTIIDQYKEKLNLVANHEQRVRLIWLGTKGGSLRSWIELTDVCVGRLVFWLGLGNVLVRGMGITKSSKELGMTGF